MISLRTAKAELLWYSHQAHADLGITSSFGSMIASAFGFSPSNSTNHTEDKMLSLASAKRHPMAKLRRIEQALRKLPRNSRRILDALYSNYTYPPQLVSIYGIRTGAALFNTSMTNLDDLVRLCSRKLQKQKLIELEIEILKRIDLEADQLFNQAHQEYIQARK